MKMILLLVIVFAVSFLLIFKMVNGDNRKEEPDEKMGIFSLLFVVTLLALLPTAAIALMLFVVLGSANIVNSVFVLGLDKKQLILLALALFLYLFTIDSLVQGIMEYIIGKNVAALGGMILIRMIALNGIGLAIGLQPAGSLKFAGGMAFALFLIEVLFHLRGTEGRQEE